MVGGKKKKKWGRTSALSAHADGPMSREKALAFVVICSVAVVFVLKTFSALHSEAPFHQNPRQHREPADTVRIEEV